MRTYCMGLPPKPSVYLVAIVDIILGFVALLLTIVALTDLDKVFQPSKSELTDLETIELYHGIERFGYLHGQFLLLLALSTIFFVLAIGLLWGVRKDTVWPIKSWLIYSCTLTLFGTISIAVVSIITDEYLFLFLQFLTVIRIYEIWVVFDYLRHSRFCLLISLSRSSSSERLHNV